LEDAYSSSRRYAVDRLLYLIAILYPQINVSQVRANLFGDDPRRRANAIELLDTVLSRSYKERFLPLLESSPERMLEMEVRPYHLVPPDSRVGCAPAIRTGGSDYPGWIVFSFDLSNRHKDPLTISLFYSGVCLKSETICHSTEGHRYGVNGRRE